jgi:hypothetical protein
VVLHVLLFLVAVSYDTVASMLGKQKAVTRGFKLRELTGVLFELGYSYEVHRTDGKWRKFLYDDGTIVFIAPSSRYPFGHYLVRYLDRWMDPWVNLVVDPDINHAQSGFRHRLPGKPQWILTQSK